MQRFRKLQVSIALVAVLSAMQAAAGAFTISKDAVPQIIVPAGMRRSCLEPDTHFKFGYLEAISEVFK